MKFLVIGLGSMGKRRLRNLQRHGVKDIIGFDVRDDRAKEASQLYSVDTFVNFEDALARKPDVFIISCPPHHHLQYANFAVDNNLHFFSEVNTVEPQELLQVMEKVRNKDIVAAPSCTLRFHPCVAAIKNLINSQSLGKPLLLTYHSGQNLEDWHPWEKVTDFYVGKKETGGGRDQIMFELEWITWLLGEVVSVNALTRKLSSIDADIFDTYDLILETKNGVIANVLVDVIQRPADRIFRLVCEKGIIHWDWITHTVKAYSTLDNKWLEIPERPGYKGYLVEEMYEEEIQTFLRALRGEEKYPITYDDEIKLLQITYAAEQSSENGKKIDLN